MVDEAPNTVLALLGELTMPVVAVVGLVYVIRTYKHRRDVAQRDAVRSVQLLALEVDGCRQRAEVLLEDLADSEKCWFYSKGTERSSLRTQAKATHKNRRAQVADLSKAASVVLLATTVSGTPADCSAREVELKQSLGELSRLIKACKEDLVRVGGGED